MIAVSAFARRSSRKRRGSVFPGCEIEYAYSKQNSTSVRPADRRHISTRGSGARLDSDADDLAPPEEVCTPLDEVEALARYG